LFQLLRRLPLLHLRPHLRPLHPYLQILMLLSPKLKNLKAL
jgi:hypothetical protein